jgi:hypothetical protein
MHIDRKGNRTGLRKCLPCSVFLLLGLSISPALSAETGSRAQQGATVTCSSGFLPGAGVVNSPPDLLVNGECHVKPDQTYYFENVNVLDKGRLVFDELDKTIKPTATHFWAQSMMIENGGTIAAGSARQPYGTYGSVLTIHLYGADRNASGPALGALFRTAQNADTGPCGIPKSAWSDNGKTKLELPGSVSDFFYRYGPLHGDDRSGRAHRLAMIVKASRLGISATRFLPSPMAGVLSSGAQQAPVTRWAAPIRN